jgi:RNA polymerase sigma-70 factor (ECF subfamily)
MQVRLTAMERPNRPPSVVGERALVERLRAGDEHAFEIFAEQYIAGLYRFAHRRLDSDRELAREIVQSTVCKVIENLQSYRGEAPLFTWLCACCRNEIAAYFRRQGRRPREVDLEEGGPAALSGGSLSTPLSAGPEERLLRWEASELVHVTLDRLPASYALAMEWRYLEGLPVAEVAQRLQSSYKATESLLSRAREAFREVYEQLTADPGKEGVVGAFPVKRAEA